MTTEQTTPIGDKPFHACHSGINWHGITYRQWLIGQALCGLCTFEYFPTGEQHTDIKEAAKTAIAVADAVLAQL